MFSLIKKYQRAGDDSSGGIQAPSGVAISQRKISFYDENVHIQDCETLSIPKLNKRTLSKQILARWLRLAFPTYIIVLFTLSMFIFVGSGPQFMQVINYNILDPLKNYWWTILLFI